MNSPTVDSPGGPLRRQQAPDAVPGQREGGSRQPTTPGGLPFADHETLAAQWRVDDLDLASYLDRLGCSELATAPSNGSTLRTLHRAHVAAIAFGNLDVVLGRSPSLDVPDIQAKLVDRRRGGYCFEQNLLFAAALERLGFTVSRLGARVQMGTADLRPRTHMALVVLADGTEGPAGTPWLADVGFGGEGLLEPVPLLAGTVVDQDGWGYRVDQLGEFPAARATAPVHAHSAPSTSLSTSTSTWMLSALHHDGPFDLYSFTTEPWLHVDYVVANHYVATHPASPFVRQLVLQQTGSTRHTLIGSALVATTPDGGADYTEVAPDELPGVLLDVFGIDVADDADTLFAASR